MTMQLSGARLAEQEAKGRQVRSIVVNLLAQGTELNIKQIGQICKRNGMAKSSGYLIGEELALGRLRPNSEGLIEVTKVKNRIRFRFVKHR